MRVVCLAFVSLLVVIHSAKAQRCDDDALSESAATLLMAADELTGAELLAVARRAGSDATTVHALAIHDGDETRVSAWLARLAERMHMPMACGEAVLN